LVVKQKKKENENFLISSVKGVQIIVTQDFLSEALKIPNEGIVHGLMISMLTETNP